MDRLDRAITDLLITHSLQLLRFTNGVRKRVESVIRGMEKDLIASLATETAFSAARSRSLIKQGRDVLGEGYQDIADIVDDALVGVSEAEARAIAKAITTTSQRVAQVTLDAVLPTPDVWRALVDKTLVFGAPTRDWWQRQSGDAAFRYAAVVRQGIASGQTSAQIIAKVAGHRGESGVLDVSRKQAAALVQASTASVASASRLAMYRANDDTIKGVRQVSTLDNRTSIACIAYAGAMWDLDGNPMEGNTLPFVSPGGSTDGVPRHWNCRSTIVPVTKSWAELGIEGLPDTPRTTRASMDGPVNANITFDEWLHGKPDDFVDALLGKGRAQLYRDKKITLKDLLDKNGSVLSLKELLASTH